jgi:hypothetical protein
MCETPRTLTTACRHYSSTSLLGVRWRDEATWRNVLPSTCVTLRAIVPTNAVPGDVIEVDQQESIIRVTYSPDTRQLAESTWDA